MPAFPKPRFEYNYDVDAELSRLDAHFRTRGIPEKTEEKTLVACWNIANLGEPAQVRSPEDYRLIAHVLRRFDVVAVQEVRDDLSAFRAVLGHLGEGYGAVFTDPAGNNERMAFVYDRGRIRLRELFAELAFVDRQNRSIKVKWGKETRLFKGFNRNPFMVAFAAHRQGKPETFDFMLVNVHLYYGAPKGPKLQDRLLEVMALSAWAEKRSKAKTVYEDDIILLGDMNLPSLRKDDPIYKALIKRGLYLTDHSTSVEKNGTDLSGDYPYDQIAFFPQKTEHDYAGETGVFDFDYTLFPDLYDEGRGIKKLRAYLRYHISDHRVLWAAFKA